jgi:hypothetical protein
MRMMKNTIKFNLEPECQDIDMAGDRGSSFLKSHGFSDDMVQVPVMILRQLIKNSIKYGKFTPTANEITVRLQIDKNTYTIEVMNPVDETCSDRLKELDKTIQFILSYQDPYEAYSIKLAEFASHPFNAEANDLSLLKIAYEGGAILDFFVSEDNFLNLSAVGSLDGDGRISLPVRGNH